MPKSKAKPKKVEAKKQVAPAVPPTTPPPAPAAFDPDVEARVKTKAEQMKEQLEKQPKVRMIIPLGQGENKGSTLTFCLNGYRIEYPKNTTIEVPQQIADMIREKFDIEANAGKEMLINRNEKVQGALS